MDDFVLAPGFTVDVPSMMDYFGLWQIQPDAFRPLVNKWNGVNINAHIVSPSAQEAAKQQAEKSYYATSEGVAIFQVQGPMMKKTSSMSGGTSTMRLRQQIRQARKDGDVIAGMLQMDTPGGAVKGNSDLSDEVAMFAAEKPMFAFVEDLTASAGVSVASQATKIFANNGRAMYGSMGTYASLIDQSRMAENLGLKVFVINAGDFKGMGEPGTPFTELQIEEVQRIVTTLNEQYLEIIAKGRNRSVESIRALADGRVIFAADALAQGLIDGIATFSEAMDQLVSLAKGNSKPATQQSAITTDVAEFPVQACGPGEYQQITPSGIIVTTTETRTPTASTPPAPSKPEEVSEMEPATLKELKAKFPKSDADWRESQIESEATLLDAANSYADYVQTQADAAASAREEAHKAELEKITADNAKAIEEAKAAAAQQSGSLGAQALTLDSGGTGVGGETGDAIQDFDMAVRQHVNEARCSREIAVQAVSRRNPKLHQAYLRATNPKSASRRRLEERFDSLGVAK